MNLYEINELINEVMVAYEEGEMDDQGLEIALKGLNIELEQKMDNIASYIKNLTAESKAIDEEIKSLQKRKKTKDNQISYLKSLLLGELEHQNKKKFETSRNKISIRKGAGKLNIGNETDFKKWLEENNKELLDYKEPTISKSKVKENLDNLPNETLEQFGIKIVKENSITIK